MKLLRRFLPIIAIISLALAGLTIGLFIYWSLSKGEVLEIKNQPFPVRTIREAAHPQGVVILKIDYCKKVAVDGRIRASFVSQSREIFLPESTDRQEPQCLATELPVVIPKDLPPDRYKIRFYVTYEVNPIRTVVENFDSAEFDVVE